jgi:hypothetical protein
MSEGMNREQAMDAILLLNDVGGMSTTIWDGMGFPFEAFLQFSQIPKEQANDNLRKLQAKIRESRDPLLKLAKEGGA